MNNKNVKSKREQRRTSEKRLEGIYIVKEYVDYYIKENNLSKRKFCLLCNIKPKVLRRIYRKNYNHNVKDLLNIANFINVPMSKFVIGLDKKAREKEY